nr:unnamed protein product [Spirometra erinaceieuropaei]
MQIHLNTNFMDLTKVFNTVNREQLRKIMQKFGCPERLTHMMRQLHGGLIVRVTDKEVASDVFAITNEVKQCRVLNPALSHLMLFAVLIYAYCGASPQIHIAYKTDGNLLNSLRIKVSARLFTTTIHDMLFADDCAINTETEADVQRSMELRLRVHLIRVDFQHGQNSCHASVVALRYSHLHQRHQVKTVDNFAYFGNELSRIKIDNDVVRRTSKAS